MHTDKKRVCSFSDISRSQSYLCLSVCICGSGFGSAYTIAAARARAPVTARPHRTQNPAPFTSSRSTPWLDVITQRQSSQ
jgi:hypothetical protein